MAPGMPATSADGTPVSDPEVTTWQQLGWGNKSEGRVVEADLGRYVLCWCASGCDGDAVPLEVGVVFVVGADSGQERECVAGEICGAPWRITGLTGRDFNPWDRIAAMDVCAGSFVVGFPDAGVTEGATIFRSTLPDALECSTVNPADLDTVASNWGCYRASPSGGAYRLCYCTPRGAAGVASCAQPEDFGFDIGTLTVLGPNTSQRFKCVKGQPCEISDLAGFGLEDGDLVLILEECGLPRAENTSGPVAISGVAGLTESAAVAATNGGSTFTFPDVVSAEGGDYRVCWCRPSASLTGCANSVDFAADAGQLTIVAPVLDHLRKCYRGAPCAIGDLEGFGLADGDLVRVLHTCAGGDEALVAHWPDEGLSQAAEAGGASVSWGAQPVWSEAGRYALCWCMGGGTCEQLGDFSLQIGELVLAGPASGQAPVAVGGHPLLLGGLRAFGLEEGSLLAVLPNESGCQGPAEAVYAAAAESHFPNGGILTSLAQAYVPTGSAESEDAAAPFWSEEAPVAMTGGTFSLCILPTQAGSETSRRGVHGGYVYLGCATRQEAQTMCDLRRMPMPNTSAAQATIEASIAAARAAGSLPPGSCGQAVWLGGQWSDAHDQWRWDNTIAMTEGPVAPSEHDSLPGPDDAYHYTNWAGGQPSAYPHALEPALYMDAATGRWHDASPGGHVLAVVCEEAVPLPAGELRLSGPAGLGAPAAGSAQHWEARAGHQLALEGPLAGVDLLPGDLLLAVDGSATPCAGEKQASAPMGAEGISYPSADGASFVWPGTARAAGGIYTLCWCRPAADVTECRVAADFLVSAGTLSLRGPLLGQHHVCQSAENCSVALAWPDDVGPEQGQLVAAEGACDADAVGSAVAFDSSDPDGRLFEIAALPAPGGARALCWCASPGCGGGGAASAVEVGRLEVLGPFAGQHFSCRAAEPCEVAPLVGLGPAVGLLSRRLDAPGALALTNQSACGTAGEPGAVAVPGDTCSEHFVGCSHSWPASAMDVPPMDYLLCWCHSLSCGPSEFVVQVGTLSVREAYYYSDR
ncbi:unnamed protein product [Prorocentrum cordatum]|uniref:C-type lectin domain-containing protein n=1 Tax=Prorocentrum cordatum TaxID=2364126 RepID=A0ABN9Q494_9DINO|nr:unnamed protein product [Polarella glacialis]